MGNAVSEALDPDYLIQMKGQGDDDREKIFYLVNSVGYDKFKAIYDENEEF